jgi:hypothetical protein
MSAFCADILLPGMDGVDFLLLVDLGLEEADHGRPLLARYPGNYERPKESYKSARALGGHRDAGGGKRGQ